MTEILCKTCGNIVQPTDHFCRKCGSPVEAGTATAEPAPSPQTGYGEFTGKPPGRRARIIEQQVTVWSEANTNSAALVELPIGSEVALGHVTKIDGAKWIEVTLPTGQKGFLPGATRVFLIQKVMLVQKSVTMHAEPSTQSAVTAQFNKDAEFYTIDIIQQAGAGWYKIRDLNGYEGYINRETKIIVSDPNPNNLPMPMSAAQQKPEITALQAEKDWFVEIEDAGGTKRIYSKEELTTSLRDNILQGEYLKSSDVVTHAKDKNGKWNQTKSTLLKFAQGHLPLRVLYEPVWGYAMEGLKWGIYIAIGLKALDTAYAFFSANLLLGLFFLGAIAAMFIPKIGPVASIVIIFLSVRTFPSVNIYLTVIAAMLVGAILGCLPGMAVGGIIGLSKKKSLPLARDATPEPDNLVLKVVALPILAGCVLWAFYFLVFNPWLVKLLSSG